jgi:hypothetical protein
MQLLTLDSTRSIDQSIKLEKTRNIKLAFLVFSNNFCTFFLVTTFGVQYIYLFIFIEQTLF